VLIGLFEILKPFSTKLRLWKSETLFRVGKIKMWLWKFNHKAIFKAAGMSKDYHCSEEGCKKSFSTKWNLNQHARNHRGPKDYDCSEEGCGNFFLKKR